MVLRDAAGHECNDPTPNSILFDWESIVGASYEIKWFSNAPMTQLVGSATSTASE